MVIPFFLATCKISRARYKYKLALQSLGEQFGLTLSGTPSAMIAIDLICGYSMSSMVELYTLRDDAKFTTVSTSLCLAMALFTSW